MKGSGRLTQYEGGYTDYARGSNEKRRVADMQGGQPATDSEADKDRKKASRQTGSRTVPRS